MSGRTILTVDDDRTIRETVAFALEQNGFGCDLATGGEEALRLFDGNRHDLVILDVSMPPGPDGLEVCRQLRRRSEVPVLFLSALVEETDRIVGLELGADDYLTKPFSPRELVARVRAILRRSGDRTPAPAGRDAEAAGARFEHERLALDAPAHRVSWDDSDVALTASEFKLLCALLRRPGHVLTRDQLMDALGDAVVSDRTIDSHLRNLRKKFRAAGADTVLETVAGVGYRLGSCL
ncbi:MAG: response regulator transcription factor [Myxococcales bacterium]|nr:MAG: response regulator transcription factor [Myxococcales bacterium]